MKTAIEYLFEEMNRIRLEDECGNIGALDFFNQQNEVFNKAKEMEKKQITNAYDISKNGDNGNGEDYYNYLINDYSE